MTSKLTETLGLPSPTRRTFLQAAGATIASLNTAACIRKPYERIMPYAKRPEDLVPGEAKYYASAFSFGGSVLGVLVKSSDGRPTKIEGNPEHPLSGGASHSFAQASVLGLYAPERSRFPLRDGSPVETTDVEAILGQVAREAEGDEGRGLAILVDETPSPTLTRLLGELARKLPKARIYSHDGAGERNAIEGARLLGLEGTTWTPTGRPRVIACFDADPMATEGDTVAFTQVYAAGRSPELGDEANRMYAIEPALTVTGANADHRLPIRGAVVADVLAMVANRLASKGLEVPEVSATNTEAQAFAEALADDLASRPRGSTLVVVGERQAPQVHALGLLINQALGNFGSTLLFTKRSAFDGAPLTELAADLEAGKVEQLVVLGGNPVYDAPGDLDFGAKLEKVPLTIHLGLHRDETGARAKWHIPKSHYLEAWGDLAARDGTVSIQQPVIAPLFKSMSEIEVVAHLLGRPASGHDLVRETHQATLENGFTTEWPVWLHDGVAVAAQRPIVVPGLSGRGFSSKWVASEAAAGFEVDFIRDATILDGRFGSSPWLQELPDPITKITWDNAALVSPATAEKMQVQNESMIEVTHHEKSIEVPVWVQAGTADGVIAIALGYGQRDNGEYAKAGFSTQPLRLSTSPSILTGAKVKRFLHKTYPLACVQREESMRERPLALSTTRADFTEGPNFVENFVTMDESHIETLLWEEPNETDGHQWAMTIDLNSCTGCGACTVACQAENNIPWVGKEDCMIGREMHWIRVDRYFDAGARDLEVKVQPLTCAQCETAPCENVCPVGATVHSPEGLNDMAYNRCIGTRYCGNNCPYKVRRFNFFHYTLYNDQEYGMGAAMQRNPDVTVRFRGVMEKCTYCVQRINKARINAKVHGDGKIRDGEVTTACAQACAAEAITFGDMNDPNSAVSKKRGDARNYEILKELNLSARTTYLAKLYNPNPKIKKEA